MHDTANTQRWRIMKGWTRLLHAPIVGLAIVLAYGGGALPVRAADQPASADEVASGPAAVEAARKLVAQGKLDDAVKALSKFVDAHPKQLDAARYLGDLYYRKADLASAERVFRDVLKAAPNDRETHNRLGGIYAAEDRVTEAINEFTASLPTASNAYSQLVELHRRRGDLYNFVAEAKDLADGRPLDFVAQYNIGKIYDAERQFRDAALYLERALVLAPSECNVLSALGSVYIDLGNSRRSFEYLNRCLNREPDDYASLVNRGDLYIELAQYEKARADLEHANHARPDGSEALVDIGYLEDVAHNWHAAIGDYLKALALDPLMREAYTNLGYDYNEHQLYALAEASYIKGLSIAPNDGRLHYLLAVVYADQGKRSLALAEYQRAALSDEADVARAASRELAILQRG
jgi:tetratricopeptide (TPR) repeat protein